MRREAGKGVFVDGSQNADDFNIHACEQHGRRADQSVMRSGKAKYAMSAAGTAGAADRQVRCPLAAVQTEFKSRLALARLRREVKSAECDQQALRGDGVSGDDADQRPPKSLRLYAKSEHATAHQSVLIMRRAGKKSTAPPRQVGRMRIKA
jgi:hypothetical protein